MKGRDIIMKSISKPIILSIFIIFNCATLFAQAPDTLWTRTFEYSGLIEEGRSVKQTIDGGYIVVGYLNAGPHTWGGDLWLVKTNANGDTLWTKTYGDSGREKGYSIDLTSDGGYILTGYKGDSSPQGFWHVWLVRLDSDGDTLWTKTFGDSGEASQGYCVQQTTGGGYIITGSYRWLIKTDSSGDILWTKTFGGSGIGYCVQQTTDGGYIVTGCTTYGSAGEAWLIKTNSSGDTLWTKTFGGIGYDEGKSVQQTTDGGYIISGHTSSFGAGKSDVWLIKTDSSGDTLWTKTFGGTEYDEGNSVQQTSDGGYIISGYTASFAAEEFDVLLIKTDSFGDTLWTKTFGGIGDDRSYSVQETSDGGYIITGTTPENSDYYDVWLIKTEADPTFLNEKKPLLLLNHTLSQNYPNPFNPSTTIEFNLPNSEFVELKIYNILGKDVSTLVSKKLNQGNHTYTFDGKILASGIYYYQLMAGDYREVKKMILLR